MAAGVFGYLGYDMVRLMEELPAAHPDPIGIPDAVLVRPTIIVVFDAVKDSITVITPGAARSPASRQRPRWPRAGDGSPAWSTRSTGRSTRRRPGRAGPARRHAAAVQHFAGRIPPMVQKDKEYILAGDIFQVVLSQRFGRRSRCPICALPRCAASTRRHFSYFLDLGGYAVAGLEPGDSGAVRDGKVTIRPIAGTRPRGATPHEDKALEDELLADPKERAEHLMLLDLGRNDVGRVAKIGTVKVTDQFFVERYSHVMHIVSNVEGKLDANRDALDALVAGFPAGTVSGAPKVRAMQIIDELEKEKRGLYAGCVGYFSAAGELDTCIVLRTA